MAVSLVGVTRGSKATGLAASTAFVLFVVFSLGIRRSSSLVAVVRKRPPPSSSSSSSSSLSSSSPPLLLGSSPRRRRLGTMYSDRDRDRDRNRNERMSSSALAGSATATMTAATSTVPTWDDLRSCVASTAVGRALNEEVRLRRLGRGSAHVQNRLRLFDEDSERNNGDEPGLVLYRDHAGWCPYCQKTMLLVEEKKIPIHISLVNMRSYGDKPADFLAKVPGGLLPALEVRDKNGSRIVTESQTIMELLDRWHGPEDGYRPMLPDPDDDAGWEKYRRLARLERELFSWWCTLVFRPEGPKLGGGNNPLSRLLGGGSEDDGGMSESMRGFLDCVRKVDQYLRATKGPWFFDEREHPTMIDFVYVSHVERMLASCAYWKGLNLRDADKWNLHGLNNWLDAFEKREPYLAFKSDYYTHVKDIPPQYGPGYGGGFSTDRRMYAAAITGRDGTTWQLPLSHDDPLQPLYRGPPLPLAVLKAVGLEPDTDGGYGSCDEAVMAAACRAMAAWKLADNGPAVAGFAARGGPAGARNPRKTFAAELADPYAASDDQTLPSVDAALRVVCKALLPTEDAAGETRAEEERGVPPEALRLELVEAVPPGDRSGVVSSLTYLRDRVGVPRDLPLAAARYLRAYLNWAVDALSTTASSPPPSPSSSSS